jgi:hypothetical protein
MAAIRSPTDPSPQRNPTAFKASNGGFGAQAREILVDESGKDISECIYSKRYANYPHHASVPNHRISDKSGKYFHGGGVGDN